MIIYAIGGGQIEPKTEKDIVTDDIDKIILSSVRNNPKVLFIPTASNDSKNYSNSFAKHYQKLSDCTIDFLYLTECNYSTDIKINEKILSSDIIYVGGGDFQRLIDVWNKLSVKQIFNDAIKNNIILSGLSSGAMCWFKYGVSDRKNASNASGNDVRPIIKEGLGFVDGIFYPHFNTDDRNISDISEKTKLKNTHAFCIDDGCALKIKDDTFELITGFKNSKGHICFWKDNRFVMKEIIPNVIMDLDELLC